MQIDCDTCEVRGPACSDCVVAALLGPPPGVLGLADDHVQAVEVLAQAGLVAPLRWRARADTDPRADTPPGHLHHDRSVG